MSQVKMNFSWNDTIMIDLNRSRNLAVRRRADCFHVPFLLPALVAALQRQSLLLFGWLLLATQLAVQAQFNYTVTNQTVTIIPYTGTSGVVAISSTINGLPVTSIGINAFSDSSITSVTIPNSVTSIGYSAFDSCTKLTSVSLGSGVTSIGEGAFYDCYSLTNIMVDPLNSAFSSVDGVLFNHNQTTLVEYPEGKPGGYMIPNSVTNIGDYAFEGSFSLTSVTIPNSVTSIEDYVFAGCTSLTNVTIGSSVTKIGDSAFNQCSSLSSVTIGNSVTSIGDYAFSGTDIYGGIYRLPLMNITIPNSVTNIGEYAFAYCYSLTNVTIGNSVTNIEDHVFYGCHSLTKVTIPNSVGSIGEYAFAYCTSLTSITIPNSVTNIGDYAFIDCFSLTNVTIGNSVTSIGGSAFYGCTSLTSVTIPNSVTNIGADAFSYCTNLTSLYFQGNAPSLGGINVFTGAPVTIYYLPGTTGWGSTFAGFPTALWTLPYPLILASNPSLGVRTNEFGFTVSWATNLNVVVEAATDLANPIWSPVQTNTLTSGSFYFSDPQWENYPSRFYRVRSQ